MSMPFFELGRNPGSVCFILELGLQKHHGLRRRKLKKTYYHTVRVATVVVLFPFAPMAESIPAGTHRAMLSD